MSEKRRSADTKRGKTASARKGASAPATHSLRLALEPRLVFDASVAVTAADVATSVIDHTHDGGADSVRDAAAGVKSVDGRAAEGHKAGPADSRAAADGAGKDAAPTDRVRESGNPDHDVPPGPAMAASTDPVQRIVFVDPRVEDAATAQANATAGTRVVMLDPTRDGIRQISAALAGQTGLQSIEIVSSGTDGGFALGRDTVTTASLSGRADEVASWRDHLADGGGIDLRGYDAAASARGQLLVKTLGDLTGAQVTATENLDGHATASESDSNSIKATETATTLDAAAFSTVDTAGAGRTVLVIDARVENIDQLLAGLSSDVRTVIIGVNDDPVTAIDAALAGGGVSSLQIVAHGSPGAFTLGRDTISAATLDGSLGTAVAGWRSAFTENADILLLGCDIDQNDAGLGLMTRLADLTGADVAASDDPTGAAALGGDWVLEKSVGAIDSAVALTAEARAGWQGLLADPVIANTNGDSRAMNEDGTLAVTGISVSDADAGDALTVTVNVSNGTVSATAGNATVAASNGGKTLTITGATADINAALATLTYAPNANVNGSDLLRVQVSDGTNTTTRDVTVTIAAVNDAPTLGSGASLIQMTEGDTNPAGTLVSTITAAAGYGDVDGGAARGIAITGTNATQGTWYYSTDGGANWTSVGARAETNALLLAADSQTMVRFIPVTDFNGTATLTYHAWDQTSGTTGTDVDLSNAANLGGTTAFSATTATATVVVVSVNDAPTLSPGGASVNEGKGNEVTLTSSAFGLYDVDMNFLLNSNPQYAAQEIFEVTALPDPAKGVLLFNGDRLVVGSTFSYADVLAGKVKYQHTGYQTTATGGTSDSFQVTVDDGAGGTAGPATITIAINPVDQAPTPTVSVLDTAYQGRRGVRLDLGISDPDQTSATWDISFGDVQPGDGTLYIDANNNGSYDAGEEVTNSTTYHGTLANLRLRYDVSNNEPSSTAPSFKVTVSDDGGGTGVAKTGSSTVTIPLRDNDDDPVLTSYAGLTDKTVAGTVDATVDSSRIIAIDTSILNVTDPDSADAKISFNVSGSPDGSVGTVQVLRGGTWYNLGAGSSFTLAEVKAGAVRYYVRTDSTGTYTDTLTFQIRDSEVREFSVARQVVDPRDGGARNAADTAYLTFTLNFDVNVTGTSGGSGGTTDPLTFITDAAPTVATADVTAVMVSEGGAVRFTRDTAGTPQLLATDTDTADAQLVYRLATVPTGGSIQLYTGSGDPATDTDASHWRSLNTSASFTQADVDAGKLRFLHDGTEDFYQSFSFTVSDGHNVTAVKTVNITVTPVNDTPTIAVSGTAQLGERDTANGAETADNGYYVFNSGSSVTIALNDVDGSGDITGDPAYQSTDTQIGFRIVTGPTAGMLQIKVSGVWQAVTGSTFVTRADLAAGNFRYVHNGDEQFTDSFVIQADDGRGQSNSLGDLQTVNLSISRFNDPPAASVNTGLQVAEGGTATIGGVDAQGAALSGAGVSLDGSAKATLSYVDPDNTSLQRQYRITDATDNGVLMRDGIAMGVGSVFTQEDLDNGLISYKHDGGEVFTDAFSFIVSDGNKSVFGSFSIKILPRNEAPTIGTLPTYQIYDSTAKFAFDSAHSNLISVADGDLLSVDTAAGETDVIKVTVDAQLNGTTYANGKLFIDDLHGATLVEGTSGGSGRLVLTGTLAQVNAALATLSYQVNTDVNGVIDLVITADDRTGGGANGGLLNEGEKPISDANNTVAKTIRLYASSVNDTPVISTPTPALSVNEDATLAFKNAGSNSYALQITDADAFGVTEAAGTVTVTVGHGTLAIGSASGVTETLSGDRRTLTLAGTRDAINAALLSMTYTGDQDWNGIDTLAMTITAKSGNYGLGGATDVTQQFDITVVPVNDDPTLTNGGAATQAVSTTSPYVFGASNNNQITIADPKDSGATWFHDQVTVTVALIGDAGGILTLHSTAGLSGTLTAANSITFTGSLADVNAALDGMTYTPSDYDLDKTVQLTVTLNDDADGGTGITSPTAGTGAALTKTVTIDLNVSNSDDPPVVTVPGNALTVAEDSPLTLTGAGNLFVLSDVDDFGANTMNVTLSVDNGTLSIASNDGATVTHSGTATITVAGTKDQVNAALDGLVFTPTANFHGTATITGNASDGTLPATQVTKTITVTPVNDRPTATGSASVDAVQEDVTSPTGVALSTLLASKYSDATDDQSAATNGGNTATALSYVAIVGAGTYDAAQGRWQVSDGSGGWIDIAPKTNSKSLAGVTPKSYSTSAALVFSADRMIRFVPAANFYGTPGSLTVVLADGSKTDLSVSTASTDTRNLTLVANGSSGTGTGSWSLATVTVSTTVDNVNDRPTDANATLAAIDEGTGSPGGATVTSLFGTAFADTTDMQGAGGAGITGGLNSGAATTLGGIAIVGNAVTSEGTWQYSTDNGANWTDIGEGGSAPSDSSAIVLAVGAKLRFVPADSNWFGTVPALTVRAADTTQTNATGVNLFQTTPDGATSTWSVTYTLDTSVTPANDAPVITGTSADPTATEQAGEGTGTDWVTLLTASTAGATDPDFTGAGPANFGGGHVTVTLTDHQTGDALRLNGSFTGVTGSSYDSTTGTLTISLDSNATTANLAAVLEAVQYRSTSDNPAGNGTTPTRSFSIVLNDGNNNGLNTATGHNTALNSNALTGTITISPVNDAPKVDLEGSDFAPTSHAATFTEGANAANPRVNIADATTATLADVDNTKLAGMSIVVGGAVDGDNEFLSIGGTDFRLGSDQGNVTVTVGATSFRVDYVAATHTFSIAGTAGVVDLATFQTLLRGMQYTQASGFDTPTAGDRTFTVTVTDAGLDNASTAGGLVSAAAVSTITVVPKNDQPRITGLTGNTWLENTLNAAPQVIDGDVTLTDADSATFGSTATLTVTGLVSGQDSVSLASDGTAVTGAVRRTGSSVEYYDGASWLAIGTAAGGNGTNFTVTFNGTTTATRAMVERVIEHLTFQNSSDDPVESRTLHVTVSDGSSDGTTQTLDIVLGITPENEAPRVTATDSVTVNEGTGNGVLVLGGNTAWNLTIADPDDKGAVMIADVTVGAGTITAVGGGATVVSGLTSGTVRLSGTEAQLNASLNALSVTLPSVNGQAASDWNGQFTVTVVVNDQGNTGLRPATLIGDSDDATTGNGDYAYVDGNSGSGNALQTTRSVVVHVTPLNDTPTISAPSTATVDEDTTLAFDGNAGAAHAAVLSVDDVADTSFGADSTLQVTVSVAHGTLTLGTVTGLTFNLGTDTDEGKANFYTDQTSITLKGSKADVDAALATLTYRPTANYSGTDTLSVAVDDLNNGGSGGNSTTASKTVALTINAVTDPVDLIIDVDNDTATDGKVTNPAGPLTLTGNEDQWINMPVGATTVDADGSETLTITISGLPKESTLESQVQVGGTGNGDGTAVTVTNGVATITGVTRDTLKQIWIKTPQDWNTQGGMGGAPTTLTVAVTAKDSANGVDAAPTTRQVDVNLHVNSQEDAPTAVADAAAVTEDGDSDGNPGTAQTATGNVRTNDSDVDESQNYYLTSVRYGSTDYPVDATNGVTIVAAHGTLHIAQDGTYTYTLDNAAAQALRSGQTPTDVFTYTEQDSGGQSSSTTLTVTINGVNDAPVVDTDGHGATAATATFTETSGTHDPANTVSLFGAATVGDVDSANISAITIAWTGVADGNSEVVTIGGTAFALGTSRSNVAVTGGFKVTVNTTAKTITILPGTGTTVTKAAAQTLLQGITYADTSDTPSTAANRVFTLTVKDAGNDDAQASGGTGVLSSAAVTSTVTVVATNDAAAVTVSGLTSNGYTINEDATLALDGAAGRPKITIADPDVGSGTITATVAVSSGPGTLTIANLNGATASGGVTSGASVTLTGTQTQVDAALATLSYYAGADVNGSATLTVTVNDGGNTGGRAASGVVGGDTDSAVANPGDYAYADGSSAAIVTTRSFTLTVAPLNDQPTFSSAPTTASVNEEGTVAFDGTGATKIQIADTPDVTYPSGTDHFTVTVTVPTGKTTVADVDGSGRYNGTGATVTGNGSGSVTIDGTLAQVNAALNALSYTAPLDYSGDVAMTVQVDDHNYGGPSGGSNLNSTTTTITVHPVSDRPDVTANNVTGNEDTDIPLSITAAQTDTVGPAETLTFVLDGIPAGWVIKDSGTALTLTDDGQGGFKTAELSAAELANLSIRPPQDWNSTDHATPTLGVTVYSSDQGAAKASRTGNFTVTVTKVSDDTVPTNDTNSMTEDTATVTKTAATGVLSNDTDVDLDQTITVQGVAAGSGGSAITNGTGVGAAVTGAHGALTLNADGSYSYALDTAAAQSLRAGQSWTDVFTYTVNDSTHLGTPKTATLTITINGADDAPVVDLNGAVTGTDTSLTYTEVDGLDASTGSALWPNATVSDADSPHLASLTIAAANILDGNAEVLRIGGIDFALGGNGSGTVTVGGTTFAVAVTASGTGATIALTVNGGGVAARGDVQTLLAGITYRDTSDNPNITTTRTFTVQVRDAGSNDDGTPLNTGLDSNTPQAVVTVATTNDAPVVNLNGASGGPDTTRTYTEAANAAEPELAIAPNAVLSDRDNQNLTHFVLTVDGVTDGAVEYLTIGGTAFAIGTDVADRVVDAGTLGRFTVTIATVGGKRQVDVQPIGATGTTVAADALTDMQALLRGITYRNDSDNPTGTRSVQVQVTDAGLDDTIVVDGEKSSNLPTSVISFIAVNDKPRLTGLDAVTFHENVVNAAPQILDSAVTLTDRDSADLNGGTLTVSGLLAEDRVGLPSDPAAMTGAFRLSGGSVQRYDGTGWVTIGTATGGSGSDFTVTFTSAAATPAVVQSLIEHLTFADVSDTPTRDRTLTITVDDGDTGGTVQGATIAVTVLPDNDAPMVDLNGASAGSDHSVTFTEGANTDSAPVAVAPDATLSDVDDTAFREMRLVVSGVQNGDAEILRLPTTGGSGHVDITLGTAGTSSVTVGGHVFTVTTTVNGGTATVTITPGGTDTEEPVAAWTTLLNGITYTNTSDNPLGTSRTVEVRVTDDGSGDLLPAQTSNLPTTTITIVPVNDQPRFSGTYQDVTFAENAVNVTGGSPAALIANPGAVSLVDADSADFQGGSITVSGLAADDVLSLPASPTAAEGAVRLSGTSVQVYASGDWRSIGTLAGGNGATLTISLNGADAAPYATVGNVERVVEALTYQNSSDRPTPGPRAITITVDDGDGGIAGTATFNLSVTPENDAPTVTGFGATGPTFTEGGAAVVLDADATLRDADIGDASGGPNDYRGVTLTFQRTGGTPNAEDVFGFNGAAATAGSVYAVGTELRLANGTADASDDAVIGTIDTTTAGRLTVTLSGNFAVTQDVASRVVQAVTYSNSSINVDVAADRTVQIDLTVDDRRSVTTVDQGAGTGSLTVTAGTAVTITPVNDPIRTGGAVTLTQVEFKENAASVPLFDDARVTITDNDNSSFNGGAVTASFAAGTGHASDKLIVVGSGDAASHWISVSGSDVLFDADGTGGNAAVVIGTISGGTDAATPLSIALNGNATPAAVQALIRQIAFTNDSQDPLGGAGAIRTVSVDVRNGAVGGATTQTATGLFTNSVLVTPENDAPVLNRADGSTIQGTTLTEWNSGGVYSGTGDTVASLVAGLGADASDVDNHAGGVGTPTDGLGLAVTAVSNANGTWQYSTDGTTWTDIPTSTSATAALLLNPTDRVRFAPNAHVNGDPGATLTLKLWDGTSSGTDTTANDPNITDGDLNKGDNDQFSGTTVVLKASITPVNDAPVNTVPGTLTGITEDTAFTFDGTNRFTIADIDVNENPTVADRTLTVTLTAQHGVLTLGDATTRAAVSFGSGDGVGDATVTATGTLAQLQALLASVTYKGDANFNGADSITITTNDRGNYGSGGALQDVDTVNFTVGAVNDAPTATSTAAITLAPVAEDVTDVANVGSTVVDLFAARMSDAADAVNNGSSANSFQGIAIVGVTETAANGQWQYQVGGTGAWIDVGDRGPASALVLGATDRLRFQPAADYNGPAPDLAVRLVEDGGTPPASGAVVDLSGGGATGGATRYSDAANQITLKTSVTAVNDRPVVTGTGAVALTVAEDASPAGATFVSLLAGRYSDAADDQSAKGGSADATALSHVAVTGNAAVAGQGVWQYSADGTTWISIPTSGLSASSALVLSASTQVRFLPAADFHGTPGALTLRMADGSANPVTASAGVADLKDLSTDGGTDATGRWSLGSLDLQPTVTSVNDAPTATGTATLAAIAEDTPSTANPGATVASLFGGLYGDAVDDQSGVAGGTDAHTAMGGVAIVGDVATATQGAWYYSTNGGTDWTALPSGLSDTNALILPTSALLRFVPTADWNGTPGGLTARLSDQTVANAATGQTLDIGGTNHWSATTVTLGTSVTAVEDAIEAQNDTNGIHEDDTAPATGNVLANDFDRDSLGTIDPQTLYVTAIQGATAPAATVIDTAANNAVTVQGRYGTLTIHRDGSYSYALDNSLPVIQQLKQGQTLTDEVFTYTVDDVRASDGVNVGSPAVQRTLSITVTGVNDAPVAVADTGAIQEDATTPASGNVLTNDTEIDANDPGTVSAVSFGGTSGTVGQALAGRYGTLTMAADGSWSYAVDNANPAVQALAAGETLTESFGYTVKDTADATSATTLTITITGVNDAPSIDLQDSVGAVTEDASAPILTDSGTIAFTDVDLSNTHTVTVGAPVVTTSTGVPTGFAPAAGFGTLTATVAEDATDLSGAGHVNWTFAVDNSAVQGLAAGETVTQVYTLTLKDSSGATVTRDVTVTITGTNDAPSIDLQDSVGAVTEDASAPTLTDSGTIAFTDVDLSNTHTVTVGAPVVTASTGVPIGFAPATGFGTLTATVAEDATDNSNIGHVNWTFAVDNSAVQGLAAGETVTQVYTLTLKDSSGATVTRDVTVTITGANDAPSIDLQDSVGAVTEDASAPTLTDSGTIAFTDVDLSNTHTVTVGAPVVTTSTGVPTGFAPATGFGTLTATVAEDATDLSGTGHVNWTFALDNSAVQGLAAGETVTQVYTLTLKDGSGATVTRDVTVTITGTNDAPAVGAAKLTGGVTEDAAATTLTDSGTIVLGDADLSDVHSATAVFANTTGTARLGSLTAVVGPDSTGGGTGGTVTWTYTVDNAAVQFLAAGQTVTETYTVTIADGKGGTVSRDVAVTITGTNDAPTIGTAKLTGAVTEDANSGILTDTGAIAFADVDLTDAHSVSTAFVSGPGTTPLGALTAVVGADSTGAGTGGSVSWTYTVDNAAVQFLAAGQTVTETYAVTVGDGHGGTVTRNVAVTITGTNDAPAIGTAKLTGGVTEDANTGALTDTGTLAFADVDLTDAHSVSSSFVSTSGTAPLGTLTAVRTADSTGTGAGGVVTWTYTVDNAAVQSLRQGETVTETYAITVSDGHGGTATRNVTVTITGTNDAPTVTGDPPTAAGNAGQAMSLTVDRDRFADVDRGDTLTFTATLADGSPLPSWLVFDPATLTFRGTPPQTAAGTLSVALHATDSAGASVSLGVGFTITAAVEHTDTPATTTPTDSGTPPTTVTPTAPTGDTLITAPTTTATGGTGAGTTGGTGLTTAFPGAALTSISAIDTSGFGSGAASAASRLTLDAQNALTTADIFRQTGEANVDLFLTGNAANQTVQQQQQASFQVPKNIFRHTNPNERLSYQATRPDGSPIPDWLHFESNNLAFRGVPPSDARGALDIVIVAKDSRGNQAAAQFRILITQDHRDQGPIGDGKGRQDNSTGPQGNAQGNGQSGGKPGDAGASTTAPSGDATRPTLTAPQDQIAPNRTAPAPEQGAPDRAMPDQHADAAPPRSMAGADAWMTADTVPILGRASFTAQLHAAGRPGLLAEARALLDHLLQSNDDGRNAA